MARIGIVGSRRFPALGLVRSFVASLPPGSVVVSGGAPGVDSVAVAAARARGLAVSVLPAALSAWGRSAGPRRNAALVASVSRVACFWDGSSPGSRSVLRLAARQGIPCLVIRPDGSCDPYPPPCAELFA